MIFACDHHDYSCYIPAYLVTIINFPDTHLGAEDLLKKSSFSVSRYGVLLARNPVNITIEQTAQYVEATLDMADVTSRETSSHKELRVSQTKSNEANVKEITEAVLSFTNSFALQNQ